MCAAVITLVVGVRVAPPFLIFPADAASMTLRVSLPLPGTGMVRSQLSSIGWQPSVSPMLLRNSELIILFTGDDLGSWDTVYAATRYLVWTSLTLLRSDHWVGMLVSMYLAFKSLSPNKPTCEHLQSPSG